jgi:hypothetical protein
MKKLLFVLSVILLTSLKYSCNENDLQSKNESASLFEDSGFLDQIKGKSLNTFPIEIIQNNFFEYNGELSFWSNGQGEFSVYLEEADTSHFFILQDTKFKGSLKDGNYKLVSLGAVLLLKSEKSNNIYQFGVENDLSLELRDKLRNEFGEEFNRNYFTNVGIIHNKIGRDKNIDLKTIQKESGSVIDYFKNQEKSTNS